MSFKRKILVLAVNLAMVVELFLAMHAASLDPDNFTATFVKSFFAMLAPTLLAAFVAGRILRSRARSDAETA